jgi:hypothetical protein
MKEFLEAIAVANNWPFEYGRSDFHNLFDEIEQVGVNHLFLDPVEINTLRNDSGSVEVIIYTGRFMLLKSSDIDEVDYNYRYENYIKPIIENDLPIIEDSLICDNEATLSEWKVIEVVNLFDYNLDGVLITFKVEINA